MSATRSTVPVSGREPELLSLLIVDDHDAFRSACAALMTAGGWDVVGQAGDAAEALDAVERLHPQVVLLDVQLPGRDGFSVAQALATTDRPPDVVLVSARGREEYGLAVARAPVCGFISKADLSPDRLRALLADSA